MTMNGERESWRTLLVLAAADGDGIVSTAICAKEI
jgi:hypothetical protein